MRNMLAFLAAAALTLVAVGWYLDWFQFRTVPADSGHRRVTVDVNTAKIGHDLIEAEHKVQKKLDEKSSSDLGASTGTVKPVPAAPTSSPDPLKEAVSGALHKIDVLPDR
jgi:hypothetical protein